MAKFETTYEAMDKPGSIRDATYWAAQLIEHVVLPIGKKLLKIDYAEATAKLFGKIPLTVEFRFVETSTEREAEK